MTDEQKVAVFQPLLDRFETEEVRLYCADMIKLIPEYIFFMPSSTSGRFHNATQCKPHGQIYHILMFAEILNYLLDLKDPYKIVDDHKHIVIYYLSHLELLQYLI